MRTRSRGSSRTCGRPRRRRCIGRATARAEQIWAEINGPNLVENILPTRSRASLVLSKGDNHEVRRVRLRKI